MYSPQEGSKMRTPERDYVAPSPLRALSPFVDAIKSAQNKANKDFENFYGNLMSRLTPRTSANRISKKIPEITQRKNLSLDHKRIEADYNRTSLTPLFERHTLREGNYIQNPFYEDSESETTDNASEFDLIDDATVNTTRTEHTRRLNGGVSNLFDKLNDESKRMEKLQSNISIIKRQSSFLADNALLDDNKKEIHIPAPPPQPVKKTKETPIYNNPTFRTPQPAGKDTYLTPPQSIEFRRLSKQSVPKSTPHLPSQPNLSVTNIVNEINDKEDLLLEISHAKLKSAEIIRTPGGTRTCNRFWKEIHGLNAKRESSLSPVHTGRVEKPRRPSSFNKRLWEDDDDVFWTAENNTTNNSSSFNQRLMRVQQFEEEKKKQSTEEKQTQYTSLEQEIESAKERENRKSLPNPLFLEELKAKYKDRLLDDSDSYKFS